MLDSIMGAMQNVVVNTATAVAASIVYQHRSNNSTTSVTNTTATPESLGDYKISGDYIQNAKKFYLTPSLTVNDAPAFLNFEAKKYDTVLSDGEVWYVLEIFRSDVELVLICSTSKIALKAKKVSFS